jgi:hypothetical protein
MIPANNRNPEIIKFIVAFLLTVSITIHQTSFDSNGIDITNNAS